MKQQHETVQFRGRHASLVIMTKRCTNAAVSDQREMDSVVEKLFVTINQIAASTHTYGERLESIAWSTDSMEEATAASARSCVLTRFAASKLEKIMQQFQHSRPQAAAGAS